VYCFFLRKSNNLLKTIQGNRKKNKEKNEGATGRLEVKRKAKQEHGLIIGAIFLWRGWWGIRTRGFSILKYILRYIKHSCIYQV